MALRSAASAAAPEASDEITVKRLLYLSFQTTRLILTAWTEGMMRSLDREWTRVVCPAAWR